MKKLKNLIAVAMVIILIFCFTVPISAVTVSDGSTSNDYKIDAELESVMNEATDNENIKVALWLSDVDNEERSDLISAEIKSAETKGELTSDFSNTTDLSVLKSTTLSTEELSEQAQTLVELKRDVEKELHTENNANVLSALSSSYDIDTEPFFVSNYAPLVIMDMTKSEIEEAVTNQLIENIYYYEPNPIVEENSELADNISISQEDTSVLTSSTVDTDLHPYGVWQEITGINKLRDEFELTGSGIIIGALEINPANFEYNGITEEDQEQLYEQFAYHIDNDLLHFSDHEFANHNGSHGNYSLSILSGFADDYKGVAPLAEIYCDGYYEEYPHWLFTPTETMINNGVNIISASFGWGHPNNGYNYIVKYFDYVISNSDVVMCISSGNAIYEDDLVYEIRSSATPYNTITVGNIDDKYTVDKTDDVRYSSSRYSGSTNIVYKPDICAPGHRVGTYVVSDKVNGGGGTSAACPVVAGICALLMEAFPALQTQPMLVKSLLMSSAYELDTVADIYSTATSIEPALTRECGPGMIDAYAAYTTYLNSNYRYSTGGYLDSYNHAVNVSQSEVDAKKDIYLSLNWMQWNTTNGETWTEDTNYNVLNGYHHTLSLYDPDGNLVAVSDYQYDRKQFIRYKPLQTGRYTAKITRSYTGSPAYYPSFAVAHCIK